MLTNSTLWKTRAAVFLVCSGGRDFEFGQARLSMGIISI